MNNIHDYFSKLNDTEFSQLVLEEICLREKDCDFDIALVIFLMSIVMSLGDEEFNEFKHRPMAARTLIDNEDHIFFITNVLMMIIDYGKIHNVDAKSLIDLMKSIADNALDAKDEETV